MMIRATKKDRVHRSVLRWYRANGRDLPWRRTRDPYRILVSEVMLQQTQVSRVLEKYHPFLNRFPTLRSLDLSTVRDVIIAWQGMGYNNRAVRLRAFTQIILRKHRGRFPEDPEILLSLPGIGRYTASAILSFSFNHAIPVVDTNVRRFLSRLLWDMGSVSDRKEEAVVLEAAGEMIPGQGAYQWNQALMDFGSLVCTARSPLCTVCPVNSDCVSAGRMKTHSGLPKRNEPAFRGIPNRIHRGRIVQFLRTSKPVTVGVLGKETIASYTARDRRWLVSVIDGLERDGLVRTKAGKVALA